MSDAAQKRGDGSYDFAKVDWNNGLCLQAPGDFRMRDAAKKLREGPHDLAKVDWEQPDVSPGARRWNSPSRITTWSPASAGAPATPLIHVPPPR